MALTIVPYAGGGDDLADLITDVWTRTFGGQAWFPLWDRRYVEWRLMDPRIVDRELIVCAYDGDRLVGCIVSEESDFRIGTERICGSLTSYLSVDPDTRDRGVAVRLLDALAATHRRRGIAIGFGVTADGPDSFSLRFWELARKRRSSETIFLRSFRIWTRVCRPAAVARAGLTAFERLGPWAAALLPWGWTGRSGPWVRPVCANDLAACGRLVAAASERADVAMVWSEARLAVQLDHPCARAFVLDGPEGPIGLVAGYLIDWVGKVPVRVGFIELCAADHARDESGLLIALGRILEAEGADMVVMMDSGGAPRRGLAMAGFVPFDPHVRGVAVLNHAGVELSDTLALHMAFT
jgi:GNAT superfamily N-acetyltransferase